MPSNNKPAISRSKSRYIGSRYAVPCVLAISFLLIACGGSKEEDSLAGLADSVTQEQPYISYLEGFRINPPDGWETIEGMSGSVVAFFNPEVDTVEGGIFPSSIVIGTARIQDLGLAEYVQATRESIPPNITLIEDRGITVRGRQAHILGSTIGQGATTIRNLQLIAVKERKAYFITASAFQDAWEKYEDLFEASLNTFEFD